jgi:hypothetical protein
VSASAAGGLKTPSLVGRGMSNSSQTPPENKIAKVVDALRIGTWSLLTVFVAALVTVTVVGPFLLGNPAVAGDAPILFGLLLGGLFVGTLGFVVAEVLLY